jgi:hypothetical protein
METRVLLVSGEKAVLMVVNTINRMVLSWGEMLYEYDVMRMCCLQLSSKFRSVTAQWCVWIRLSFSGRAMR